MFLSEFTGTGGELLATKAGETTTPIIQSTTPSSSLETTKKGTEELFPVEATGEASIESSSPISVAPVETTEPEISEETDMVTEPSTPSSNLDVGVSTENVSQQTAAIQVEQTTQGSTLSEGISNSLVVSFLHPNIITSWLI